MDKQDKKVVAVLMTAVVLVGLICGIVVHSNTANAVSEQKPSLPSESISDIPQPKEEEQPSKDNKTEKEKPSRIAEKQVPEPTTLQDETPDILEEAVEEPVYEEPVEQEEPVYEEPVEQEEPVYEYYEEPVEQEETPEPEEPVEDGIQEELQTPPSSEDISDGAYYTNEELIFQGEIYEGDTRYTWYSESVLPGGGLDIPGRHVEDGYVMDEDGNVCVASCDYEPGTQLEVPFGNGTAVVYDECPESGTVDIYVE